MDSVTSQAVNLILFFLFVVSVNSPGYGKRLKYSSANIDKADVFKGCNEIEEEHLNSQSAGPHKNTYGEELGSVVPPYASEN